MKARSFVSVPGHVMVAHLDGEAVLLHLGNRSYVSLNATAAFVWRALEQQQEHEQIVQGLCSEFDATPEEARTALDTLLDDLLRRDLLRAAPPSSSPVA
jgi:hypothetical protein